MISNKTTHAIELCVLLAGQRNAVYLSTTELALRLLRARSSQAPRVSLSLLPSLSGWCAREGFKMTFWTRFLTLSFFC